MIRQLEEMLKAHQQRHGNPKTGWIFNTSNDTPLSLHNVTNRVILPMLNRCAVCSEAEIYHRGADHEYDRDASRPEWHGFHAARRGIGTNLNRLGVDDSYIQKILRHSNLSTTQTYYIKTSDSDKQEAMKKYEAEVARIQAEIQRLQHLRTTMVSPADSTAENQQYVN